MTGTHEPPREIPSDPSDQFVRPRYGEGTPRRVSILGATGSVGTSTVDLIARANTGREAPAFDVVALTANRNVDLLIERARALRPDVAVIGDEQAYRALADGLSGTGIEAAAGEAAVVEAAGRPADWTMAAIVGAAGLAPTLAALAASRAVALANKECLVCAGELFLAEAQRRGTRLLPVDSEHNAVFQVFDFDRPETVESIVLTASGGPFRTFTREAMARVTPAEACAHPNWSMGAKISIDSATMMNKGLELIEAFYLFPVGAHQLSAVVHPQSIVHALVRYVDGSVLAQLGSPDMRTPIAHALAWPERMRTPCRRLDFSAALSLTFEPPDEQRFPALGLARIALERRGPYPTVLNAANEVAVAAFLGGRIGFLDIATTVDHVLTDLWDQRHPQGAGWSTPDLEGLMAVDADARLLAEAAIARQQTVSRPVSHSADTRAAS